jgi:hypothetical protein
MNPFCRRSKYEPMPKPEPKPCPNCSTAYAQGYKKGFADAVRQYVIDKEEHQ